MPEMGTSGLMSGEGKPPAASRSRPSALPRLYAFRIEYLGRQEECASETSLQASPFADEPR